jgi:anti-anti-sigma factor
MGARVQVDSKESGNVVEIKLSGAADVSAAAHLKECLLRVMAADRDFVLNLDALERLDGAGLQVLLSAKAFAEHAGRSFRVEALGEAAARAFDTAGASALFARSGPTPSVA